ncbi:aminoglycoside 3'-phosphotransferase [Planctomonas sp. JC2975]|uniref:aminoglycoside 3'-phosphotransferase n=1 Tax=Planctomonas sp. JC2975 TaxID=2729626 RepID=UPI001474A984|nr:aminoglycoside 3'-phosphotransferase [Planctomonas sp. JC2975]NNC10768.1 aminoglycoside 3'-phosphotransferase [Planctomonas sp. JC2975]
MTGESVPADVVPDSGTPAGSHDVRAFSGTPDASFAVPEPLTRRFGDDIDEVTWVNEVGGVTVRARVGDDIVFAKWAPPNSELDLEAEAERLAWAATFVRVPIVLDFRVDDDGEVLVTRGLSGANAVTERWRADPERAVRALGSGLRAFHDAVPVEGCPYSWSVSDRIARSRSEGIAERVAALDVLGPAPSIDRLVVCHADACAPNTLLADDGTVAGYVDLGRLGVADRWADIAIGAWSTEWNYGPGYTDLYYESYGVRPDAERIAFYRALWDAT